MGVIVWDIHLKIESLISVYLGYIVLCIYSQLLCSQETPAKVTAQKPAAAAKKGPSVPVKKADTSSSESEESSESEDEVCVHA